MSAVLPSRLAVGEITLTFQEQGPLDAPTMVLLHGLSASTASWQPVIDRFSPDWRVFALDLRGHGDSDHADGRYALRDYCADVEALLRHVGEPSVVVGHSLGAVVAAVLAERHPLVRAAFLEDPPLYVVEPSAFRETAHAEGFARLREAVVSLQGEHRPVEDYEALLAASPHPAGGTLGDHLLPDALAARAAALASMDPDAIAATLDGRTFGDFEPEMRFRCPVAVLRADPRADAWFRPEHEDRLLVDNPCADIQLIPGAGHNIRGDRLGRDPYLDALADFLRGLERPGEKSLVAPGPRELRIAENGSDAEVAVVFIHGWPDSWRSFEPVMRRLPHRMRTVAVSLRGFGDSSAPTGGFDMDSFAEDVLAVLDARGITRAVFVGHSMGTLVAQRIAAARPAAVLGLVLIGGLFRLREEVAEEIQETLSELTDPIDPDFVRAFQASTLAAPVADGFFDQLIHESLRAPAAVWRDAFAGIRAADTREDMTSIAAPTLLIWGDQDGLVTREEQHMMEGAMPSARLVVYAGAGHSPNWEQPERVAADICTFVRSIVGRRFDEDVTAPHPPSCVRTSARE